MLTSMNEACVRVSRGKFALFETRDKSRLLMETRHGRIRIVLKSMSGSSVKRSTFRRAILVTLITAPPILLAACVAYAMFAWTDGFATAPGIRAVPVPEQWSKREIESAGCSASGGIFCRYAALRSNTSETREGAAQRYQGYLAELDWRRIVVPGEVTYLRGPKGAETKLVVAVDGWIDPWGGVYSSSELRETLMPDEFLVSVSFADWGVADRHSKAVLIAWSAAAAAAAPAFVVLIGAPFR
jgi:hypothetical protein